MKKHAQDAGAYVLTSFSLANLKARAFRMLTTTFGYWVGLEAISLDYRESSRVDRHGNEFRYRSRSWWANGETRSVWNVFLVAQ